MAKKSDFEWLEDRPEWMKNAYRLKLEVEYRRVAGIAFQLLFDRIMRSIHGGDYSATATYGSEGDLGCDGFLRSKKVTFAVYAPSPYFKLKEATAKMRSDFRRMLDCWEVPGQVTQWVFVINYPGVHPSLLALAQELENFQSGCKVFVWSRYDLTQQLLAFARIDLLSSEFGLVETATQRLAPLNFVPEDTALPSEEATLTYRRIRAKICNQKEDHAAMTETWLEQLGYDPLSWMIVHVQFLVGAMAAAILSDAFLPQAPPISRLKFETGISNLAWRKYFKQAWGIPAKLILQDDYEAEVPLVGEDLERIYSISMVQDALTVGVIRVISRLTGVWEADVLEEVWSHVTEIKIHDDL